MSAGTFNNPNTWQDLQANLWGGTTTPPASGGGMWNFNWNTPQNNPNSSGLGAGGANLDQTSLWGTLKSAEGLAAGAQMFGAFADVYNGYQTNKLGKEQLQFSKDAFWSQFNQQVKDRENQDARRKAASTGTKLY